MARDSIILGIVRRHLLCPVFAPRFVSAFFPPRVRKRNRPPMRGSEEGRRGVRRFGPRSCRRSGSLKRYSYSLRTVMDGGGLRASAANGATLCQEDYYIRLFDLFAMDPMFHAVFHACHGGHRPGRCLESDDRERARKKQQKIMHDSLFSRHLRLCPCVH